MGSVRGGWADSFSSIGEDLMGVKPVTTAAASGGGGVDGGGTLNRCCDFCESPNFPDEDDEDVDCSLMGMESEEGMVSTLMGVNPAGLKYDMLALLSTTLLSSFFSLVTALVVGGCLMLLLFFPLPLTLLLFPEVRSFFGESDFRFTEFGSREVVVVVVVGGGGRPLEDAIVERAELGGSFAGAVFVRVVGGNLGPSAAAFFPTGFSTLVDRIEDPPSTFVGFGFMARSVRASISDSNPNPFEIDGRFWDAIVIRTKRDDVTK